MSLLSNLIDKESLISSVSALKDKPKHIPSKGYKFLSSLKPGDRWITSTGTQGILIECNANARVIIQKAPGIAEEDRSYYLGTKIISSTTEVKEISSWVKKNILRKQKNY